MRYKYFGIAGILLVIAIVYLAAGKTSFLGETTKRQAIANKNKHVIKIKGVKEDSILLYRRDGSGIGLNVHRLTDSKSEDIKVSYNDTIKNIADYRIKLINKVRQVDLSDVLRHVDTAVIAANIRKMVGVRNYQSPSGEKKLDAAKEYVRQAFINNGLIVTEQTFYWDGKRHSNVVGILPGTLYKDLYVLGAHIDTTSDSPGADDNLSGIAGMLEVMRLLSHYTFQYSIAFVAFDLEEYGSIGSMEYIRKSKEDNFNIQGAFNFDMIGYYSEKDSSQYFPPNLADIFPQAYETVSKDHFRGNFIVTISNESSIEISKLFASCIHTYTPNLKHVPLQVKGKGEALPTLRRSDHAIFWDNDIPAINIGDGADTRYKFYHSPQDLPDNLNYTKILQVVQATSATLSKVAKIENNTIRFINVVVEHP